MLGECINFIGEASDDVGRVINELNGRIDAQEVQIEQLANMVNDLVRRTER
jgi:cell division protein FtsL